MTFLAFFIGFGYAILILALAMEAFTYKPTKPAETTVSEEISGFSVIVNFRNEQEMLPHLLNSIAKLNFASNRMQFIFINDGSIDSSMEILTAFKANHNHIDLAIYERKVMSASAKKDGITQSLEYAKNNHIITTDADCVLPENWLHAFEKHYKLYPDSIFIAAPVQITAGNNILEQVQASEMVALQLMTTGGFSIGQPFLCNGANMSFKVSSFKDVGGYEGNDGIASGDDIFLLEKLAALDARSCYYLKNEDATVLTNPKLGWNEIINQRARWAQKGSKTKSLLNKLMSAQVFAANLFMLLAPLLVYLDLVKLKIAITVLALKLFTDVLVLIIGYRFFENKNWQWYVIPQLIIYPFVVVAVAVTSFTAVRWKDRVAQH